MMNRRIYLLKNIFIFFTLSFLLACKHVVDAPATGGTGGTGGGTGGPGGGTGGTGQVCDSTKIYFQQQVLPILLSNCAMSGCHDDASHQDGIILTSYEKVMSTGDVRPGRPYDSDLVEVLIETDPDDRMPRPPRDPLSAAQINTIRNCIEQGAMNLSCQSSSCDSTIFSFAAVIKPIITNNCQGCHSGITASAGIDLTTYSGVKAKVTDGRLWGAVNHFTGYSPMPKNAPKLTDCDITKI